MIPRRIAGRLALAAALLLIPACHAPKPQSPGAPAPPAPPKPAPESPAAKEVVPEEGGEGTFALEDPFTSIAAAHLATPSDRAIRSLAFHGLTRMTASGQVEAELVLKWDMLDGGATWVFHLRPDVPFTNGRFLEARHVVASWEKVILAADSPDAWLLEGVKGFDEARAGKAPHVAGLILVDGLTLRVELRYAILSFPARLSHPALGISAFGEDEQGIGPYQIWGTPKPQLVVLRSSPEYFRGLPHLDEIAFVRGEAAIRDKISAGKLDTSVLPPLQKPSSDPLTRVYTFAAGRVYLLGMNRTAAPFSHEEMVARFLASLDREELTHAVGGDEASVPSQLLEAAKGGGGENRKAPSLPSSPAGLGKIDVVYPEGDKTASLLAEKLGAWLQKGGGHLVPHAVHPADLPGALARKEYQLFIVPWIPSTIDPLLSLEEIAHWNRSLPASFLAGFRDLEGEGDASRIAAGLSSLDRTLREQGYLVPLVRVPRRLLVGKGICGLHPDPLGGLDWPRLWRSRRPGRECD